MKSGVSNPNQETNKVEQCTSGLQQTSISQLPTLSPILIFSDYLAEIRRQEDNLNKEQFCPEFWDKSRSNEAAIVQQEEVKYLLDHEDGILYETKNAIEVKSLFEQLKKFKDMKSYETTRFLAREKLLDELNAAIIEVKILESQSNEPENLICDCCFLTRFPGKIITKHIDYFKALLNLALRANQLKSLPPQIGQLVALQWLNLNGNELQSLPSQIGQLKSLQALYVINNKLLDLPREIGQMETLRMLGVEDNQLIDLPDNLREGILGDAFFIRTKSQVLDSQKQKYLNIEPTIRF